MTWGTDGPDPRPPPTPLPRMTLVSRQPHRFSAAQILALGGTLASALTAIGGLAGSTITVGLAGAVMFVANVAVLAGAGRRAS